MCWQLHEMGGGVDDVHRCATHIQEFYNQETADQSMTSSMNVNMSNWTATEIQEMLVSPRSL